MHPPRPLLALTSRWYVRGLPRMLWLSRRLFAQGRAPYRLHNGLQLRLSTDDYFQWMMLWGYYSPHIVEVMKQCVDSGQVCLDLGAHIGYTTLLTAERLGPKGMVIAVEPDPRARALLHANIAANRSAPIAPVTVIDRAIGESGGFVRFRLATQLGWSTALGSGVPMTEAGSLQVPLTTIDQLVRDYVPLGRSVTFVKLDVEGYEIQALRSARSFIEARTAAFLVEVNPHVLAGSSHTAHDLLRVFFSAGYHVALIDPDRGPAHRAGAHSLRRVSAGESIQGDILATP